MQYIWQRQRLDRAGLQTVDGRQCEVLHPGFLNRGAGPDFKRALIRLNGEVLLQGDVEIDRRAAGWKAHGHENNPSFDRVVLRVVWSPPRKLQSSVPMLALEPFLDCSLVELAKGFATDSFCFAERILWEMPGAFGRNSAGASAAIASVGGDVSVSPKRGTATLASAGGWLAFGLVGRSVGGLGVFEECLANAADWRIDAAAVSGISGGVF